MFVAVRNIGELDLSTPLGVVITILCLLLVSSLAIATIYYGSPDDVNKNNSIKGEGND